MPPVANPLVFWPAGIHHITQLAVVPIERNHVGASRTVLPLGEVGVRMLPNGWMH
jgi:hypothetical protein